MMAQAVADNLASPEPDPVVIGGEYRDGLWKDSKSLVLLDEATGDNPVALASVDVHSGWLNSAALSLLQVTDHDEQGVIRERPWFQLTQRLSANSETTLDGWVLEAAHEAASRRSRWGLLTLKWGIPCRIGSGGKHPTTGPYPLQVEAAVYPDDLERALEEGMISGVKLGEAITVGPFKIITDGSLNTRTAHCVEPYLAVEGEEYGAMNFPPRKLRHFSRRRTPQDFGWPFMPLAMKPTGLFWTSLNVTTSPGALSTHSWCARQISRGLHRLASSPVFNPTRDR